MPFAATEKSAWRISALVAVFFLSGCGNNPQFDMSGNTPEKREANFRASYSVIKEQLPPDGRERLRRILFYHASRYDEVGEGSNLDEVLRRIRREMMDPWGEFWGHRLAWTSKETSRSILNNKASPYSASQLPANLPSLEAMSSKVLQVLYGEAVRPETEVDAEVDRMREFDIATSSIIISDARTISAADTNSLPKLHFKIKNGAKRAVTGINVDVFGRFTFPAVQPQQESEYSMEFGSVRFLTPLPPAAYSSPGDFDRVVARYANGVHLFVADVAYDGGWILGDSRNMDAAFRRRVDMRTQYGNAQKKIEALVELLK